MAKLSKDMMWTLELVSLFSPQRVNTNYLMQVEDQKLQGHHRHLISTLYGDGPNHLVMDQ